MMIVKDNVELEDLLEGFGKEIEQSDHLVFQATCSDNFSFTQPVDQRADDVLSTIKGTFSEPDSGTGAKYHVDEVPVQNPGGPLMGGVRYSQMVCFKEGEQVIGYALVIVSHLKFGLFSNSFIPTAIDVVSSLSMAGEERRALAAKFLRGLWPEVHKLYALDPEAKDGGVAYFRGGKRIDGRNALQELGLASLEEKRIRSPLEDVYPP